MQRNREDALSGFVRMKIREWKASNRELQDLARIARIAKSAPSNVLGGMGVGNKTGPGYARAFGFASYDDMRAAAYRWWQESGAEGAKQASDPDSAAGKAVDAVLGLGQGTRPQLETIVAAYAHPRFTGRDVDWWVTTLLEEVRLDRASAERDALQRKVTRRTQKEIRETAAKRREPKVEPEPSSDGHRRKAIGG